MAIQKLRFSGFGLSAIAFQAYLIRQSHVDEVARAANNVGMAESFSSRLSPIFLPEATNGLVQLGTLWASRPAVIVFLRHYG